MSNRKSPKIKHFSYSIIMLSLMLILSYIEALFPFSVGNLGIKIGLCNILTIIGLKILSIKEIFIINILRLIILGIFFGNVVRFQISLAGFLLSFIVMSFLLIKLKFSIIITSIFGAVFHNIGQVICVSFITKNINLLTLLPVYIIIGCFTGFLIGVITDLLYTRLIIISFDKKH